MLFIERCKKLSLKDSDIGFQEYKNFLQNVVFVSSTKFKSYGRTESRLEKFFFEKVTDSGRDYEDYIMSETWSGRYRKRI